MENGPEIYGFIMNNKGISLKADIQKIKYQHTDGQVRAEPGFLPAKARLFRSQAGPITTPARPHAAQHIKHPQIIKINYLQSP